MTRRCFTAFCLCIFLLFAVAKPCRAQNGPSAPVSKLSLPAGTQRFPFYWSGDSIHGKYDPYAALLVPVKLPGCTKQFYMQFDLGSNISMFYRSALQSIQTKYPGAVTITNDTALSNYSFFIGDMPVAAAEILLKDFGAGNSNWTDPKAIHIIGTIGTDFITDRFLAINYVKREMVTGNTMPASATKEMVLSDLIYVAGKILLPATIRGKQQLFYFDTGASAFYLMTDKTNSEMLASKNAVPVSFKVNSWGKQLAAFTIASGDSVRMASKQLPLQQTSYIEGVNESVVGQMMKMGITGLIGNKLFLNSILFIDLKNKKFGLR